MQKCFPTPSFPCFSSEVSAGTESFLSSLPGLSIFWQQLGNLGEGSQPEQRAKAEADVGGEVGGERERSSASQSAREA